MSKSQIKLCIIGAGRHASRNIYPMLYRLEADIVANCDLDRERASAIGRKHGIPRSYGDYREMIRVEKPDAMIVCVSGEFHATIAIELMEAGIDVYTEKPNAESFERSLQVLRTQERTGRICMTGFKKRFTPVYVKTKKLIESPGFGEKGALNMIRTGGFLPPDKSEPADRETLLRFGIHTVDLVSFLWGSVETVRTARTDKGGRFAWSVTMQHVGGATSHQLLTYFPLFSKESLYMVGTGGLVIEVENSVEMVASRGGRPIDGYTVPWVVGNHFSDIEQGFVGELAEFVDAVKTRCEPEANIRESCHTMAIFEALWTSGQTGELVKVESIPTTDAIPA